MKKILVVDDEKPISDIVKFNLAKEGYEVFSAYDGEEGVLYAKQEIYDVIILDIMLPIMDGYGVLSELRNNKIYTPVLILTAKDGIGDKVKGFRYGADDFLVKPFNREELIVRLEALIRRANGNYYDNIIEYKGLVLDLNSRKVQAGDKEIILQGKQFDVLEYLIKSKNTIITKEQIFDKIWGFDSETTTNVIEVYASGLRKELKKIGYDKYLKTIRGVGYIWSE